MRSRATLALAGVLVAAPLAAQRLDAALVDRYARVLAMADARRFDPGLIDSLLHPAVHPALRRAATTAIGQVRAPRQRGRLAALLADADTGVAAAAALSLALGRELSAVLDSAPALVGPGLSRAIGRALAVQRDSAAARTLTRLLREAAAAGVPPDPALVVAAGLAPVPPVAELLSLLRHSDVALRWAAAYALSRSPQPAAARALAAAALESPEPAATATSGAASDTRAFVARGLSHRAAGDSLRAMALRALARLARDPHPHVRIAAGRALASYGAAARGLLLALARDPAPNVRIAVVQELPPVLGPDAAGWAALWAVDTTFPFRASVLASAAAAGIRLPALDTAAAGTWVRARDWRRRRAAIGALAALGATAFAPLGPAFARDADARVRAAALQAWSRWTDSAGTRDAARAALREGVADHAPGVLGVALAALARPGASEPGDLARWWPRLRAILAADTGPSAAPAWRAQGEDAQRAAVRLLGALWAAEGASAAAELRDAVAALPAPPSAAVRAAAEGVPALAHWSTAPPAPAGPTLDYVEVVRTYVVPALEGRPVRATLHTARGRITLELLPLAAPLTVRNFVALARSGFFDGQACHRVVPAFVVQCGDPTEVGSGGPGWAIRDELNGVPYERGTLGMALSGPDTGGSQWFITLMPQPHLDGGYTVFGRVRAGWAALDAIVQGDRLLRVEVPRQF